MCVCSPTKAMWISLSEFDANHLPTSVQITTHCWAFQNHRLFYDTKAIKEKLLVIFGLTCSQVHSFTHDRQEGHIPPFFLFQYQDSGGTFNYPVRPSNSRTKICPRNV